MITLFSIFCPHPPEDWASIGPALPRAHPVSAGLCAGGAAYLGLEVVTGSSSTRDLSRSLSLVPEDAVGERKPGERSPTGQYERTCLFRH